MSADVNGLTPLSPNMPVPTCVGPSPRTLHGRVVKIASALTAIQPDSASRMPCPSSSIVALSSGERTNGARSGRLVVSLYSVQVELAAGQTSCPVSKVSRTPAKGKSPVKTKLDAKTKSHAKAKVLVTARKRHAK